MRVLIAGFSDGDREVISALPDDALILPALVADELVESAFTCYPDIALVSRAFPDFWSTLRQINLVLPVPVIVVAEDEEDLRGAPLEDTDIFGYLVRPLNPTTLRQMIAIAQAQFQRLDTARWEAAELRNAFAARKIVERAKGVIMQRHCCSEAEAYGFLRDESRRKRTPISEIAGALIAEQTDRQSNKPLPSAA